MENQKYIIFLTALMAIIACGIVWIFLRLNSLEHNVEANLPSSAAANPSSETAPETNNKSEENKKISDDSPNNHEEKKTIIITETGFMPANIEAYSDSKISLTIINLDKISRTFNVDALNIKNENIVAGKTIQTGIDLKSLSGKTIEYYSAPTENSGEGVFKGKISVLNNIN